VKFVGLKLSREQLECLISAGHRRNLPLAIQLQLVKEIYFSI